jgi:GT2 family glycosyltransferase
LNWAAILTLNNLELTKQVVYDLLRQDIGDIWILIVDNGSTDGTQDWARRAAKENQIQYICNETNIGVGPAWNQACRYVFGLGATHLLVCNNDLRLRPDTYRHLLTPRGGLVTPVNVGSVERMLEGSVDVSFDAWRKGGPDFSCFLVRDWFWEGIGHFPECYWPAYYEDNETHHLARCKGYDAAIFSTGIPYYHIGSQTIKANPELAVINARQFEKNKALYVQRWGGLPGHERFDTPRENI